MSSFDRRTVLALAGVALLTGCTAEPLLAPNVSGEARYAVEAPKDRFDQQLREALLFRLNGGADPRVAPLRVTIVKTVAVTDIAIEAGERQPTLSRLEATAIYTVRAKDTSIVASGQRTATASFDRGNQQFANIRAKREAEDRAAKVLGERVATAIRQQLADG